MLTIGPGIFLVHLKKKRLNLLYLPPGAQFTGTGVNDEIKFPVQQS